MRNIYLEIFIQRFTKNKFPEIYQLYLIVVYLYCWHLENRSWVCVSNSNTCRQPINRPETPESLVLKHPIFLLFFKIRIYSCFFFWIKKGYK